MKTIECIEHPIAKQIPVFEYVIATEDNVHELAQWIAGPHEGKAIYSKKWHEWRYEFLSSSGKITFGNYFIRRKGYNLPGAQSLSESRFKEIYERYDR